MEMLKLGGGGRRLRVDALRPERAEMAARASGVSPMGTVYLFLVHVNVVLVKSGAASGCGSALF